MIIKKDNKISLNPSKCICIIIITKNIFNTSICFMLDNYIIFKSIKILNKEIKRIFNYILQNNYLNNVQYIQ